MAPTHLDLDVLRTLVRADELGSFHRASREVGRSQSAVSQQLHRLEDLLGEKLFRKNGRGLAPTESGEVVLGYARRMLDLNDEAVAAVRGQVLEGVVRFGLPGDFAESWLPAALGRFSRAHPSVRLEVVVDRNRRLLERLGEGQLDLALTLGTARRRDAQEIATLPWVWVGPAVGEPVRPAGAPIPLAVFESPCFFRQAALAALDRAGLPWRIAFVSPSLRGLWAAVEAGLGFALRTPVGLPAGVKMVGNLPRPEEPPVSVSVHDRGASLGPAAAGLRAIVVDELVRNLAAPPLGATPRSSSRRRQRRRS